jgi:hypothetical protein
MTKNGSKWSNKKKIRREVRENESLNENIEEDRSARKMDHGQLSKKKNSSTSALEHLMGKKER